jgi:DnaJ-class molecular chaperone
MRLLAACGDHRVTDEATKCACVACWDCKGTGRIEYRTGLYPEWDLETCPQCDGSGIEAVCAHCQDQHERDEAEEYR